MKKVRRITAWITIIIIVGLIIGMVVCAITGSKYFFGFLALTFFVPIVLWVFMWFTRLVNGKSEVIPDNVNMNEKGACSKNEVKETESNLL